MGLFNLPLLKHLCNSEKTTTILAIITCNLYFSTHFCIQQQAMMIPVCLIIIYFLFPNFGFFWRIYFNRRESACNYIHILYFHYLTFLAACSIKSELSLPSYSISIFDYPSNYFLGKTVEGLGTI